MGSRKSGKTSKAVQRPKRIDGEGGEPRRQEASMFTSRHPCNSERAGIHGLVDVFHNMFGSCGTVVEAAADLVKSGWSDDEPVSTPTKSPPARGQPRPTKAKRHPPVNQKPEPAGIPSYLGAEENSLGFDDSISALSAYTLEEMARLQAKGVVPASGTRHKHPSPQRMSSLSSNSSDCAHTKRKGRKKKSGRYSPEGLITTSKAPHRYTKAPLGIPSSGSSSSSEFLGIWDVSALDNGR